LENKSCKKCNNELPEDWNNKLCEECRGKRKNIIKKVLIVGGTFVCATIVAVLANFTSNGDDNDIDISDNIDNDDSIENSTTTTIKQNPRYKVELKAFITGEWYSKTETDNIGSAYSVAECNSYGRAYRVIDTDTGNILTEADEDASMAESNGYPNGYPW